MLGLEVLFPIVGKTLVERNVLISGNVLWLSHPDWFGLVKSLVFVRNLLDLFGLFLLWFIIILDFWLIIFLFLVFLLIILFLLILIRVSDFLIGSLFNHEVDWETDELRVLFDKILDLSLFKELLLIFLKFKDDLGSSGNGLTVIWVDGESSSSVGFPFVLDVIVMFGDNSDLLGNEISGVETDTELTDHANIGTSGDSLHETSGSRFGNGTKVVNEITFGHTNTTILNGKSVVSFIWDDLDSKIWLSLELLWLSDGVVSDLVKSIRGVGNKLSQENFFVGVESVDDQRHQLLDIGVEREDFFGHGVFWLKFLN